MQLMLKSASDNYFIGNPQISFYKVVYRRYSNFSIESIDISLKKNTISEDSNTDIPAVIIPRNADLLSNVYLTFTLPNIYSGSYNADGNDAANINNIPYEFRWVENIGTNLINFAKLHIDTTEINHVTGQLMQVLSEITYDDSKKKLYDEMIGNVPELYNPIIKRHDNEKNFIAVLTKQGTENYTHNTFATDTSPKYLKNLDLHDENTRFSITADTNKVKTIKIENAGKNLKDHYRTRLLKTGNTIAGTAEVLILHSDYPHMKGISTNQNTRFDKNTDTIITKNSDIGNNSRNNFIPSIYKKKCKVPIPFYFTKNTGLALPLIALPKSEVKVEFQLNSIKNLYTILKLVEEDDANLSEGPLTNPEGVVGGVPVAPFLPDFQLTRKVFRTKPEINISTFLETNTLNLDLKLEANYIFLDDEERKRFALNTHRYLIEEYQYNSITGITKTKDHRVNLFFPVKEIIIVSQRNDMPKVNNWNNYSNWPIEDVAPYSEQYHNYEYMYYSSNHTPKYLFFNKHDINTTDTDKNFKMKYFHKNIIDKISFNFNGISRQEIRDSEYYNILQPFQHYPRKIKNGIHLYSFSLNPNEYQPSGCCNFSLIDALKINIDLGIKTGEREIPSSAFTYNFEIYAVNYNILHVESGSGAKQYSN